MLNMTPAATAATPTVFFDDDSGSESITLYSDYRERNEADAPLRQPTLSWEDDK